MIDKLAKNECCGCNACGDICPNESISFNKDEEGFLYPHIMRHAFNVIYVRRYAP